MRDASIRDFIGYGKVPLNPEWPNNARLAVNFVVNIEEGDAGEPIRAAGVALSPGVRRPDRATFALANACFGTSIREW